ncbi:MAG: S9 family peptidase [Gemmatimonadales bacterium]|nr:S9 family peptidase [Gemmatimonadales bacterium]
MQRSYLHVAVLLVGAGSRLGAQEPYREPSAPIVRILDGAPLPLVQLSPDRTRLLLMDRAGLPPLSEAAVTELRLAGERIDPRINAQSRVSEYTVLVVQPTNGGDPRRVVTPWKAKIRTAVWSPDGLRIAITLAEAGGVSLWIADAVGGEIKMVHGPSLNATFGNPCQWFPTSTELLCTRIPASRGALPADARDEALFEHYFTNQLTIVPVTGPALPFGAPGLHSRVELSPDGRYVLVETLQRPFSRLAAWSSFPARTEIRDLTGSVVHTLSTRGPLESDSWASDAVPSGPRDILWRSDAPATLTWTVAQDGGDPRTEAKVRDRIFTFDAPFNAAAQLFADLEHRNWGVMWGGRNTAIVKEGWSKTGRTRTWLANPSTTGPSGAAKRLLMERSSEDRYADPGTFLTGPGPWRRPVLLTSRDGRSVFLAGEGASPLGDRPFLDRLELATGKTFRLFRAKAPYYEEVVAILDAEKGWLITQRESASEAPNYFLRELEKPPTRQLTQLTRITDPAPSFAGVTRQLITYKRADGVPLSAMLYLPPDYDKSKGRLPFLLWAGSEEYRSPLTAGQVAGSPYRFSRPVGASHLFLLLQGYGILEAPSMPVIGPGEKERNDAYLRQITASAQAAVEKIVAMGVADPKRIGIGGQGKGAFLAASLLAHTPLFRAGVALGGAYDRTVPPLGLEIKEPLLVIDAEAFPARLGNSAKVRLVTPPAGSRGYHARESVGHALYEMTAWLDRYVKAGTTP